MDEPKTVGTAYDSIAADYDGHLARDRWVREILWRHFDRIFRAGDQVVDVGCGTGIDTLHLASSGIRVTAIDVSPKMVAEMRAKLERASLSSLVSVHIGDVMDLAPGLEGPFAGIVSSFAALNTVNLATFAQTAGRLLRPGGRLVCHMLSPGNFSRWIVWPRKSGTDASSLADRRTVHVGGKKLVHLNLSAAEVYSRFFAANFVVRAAYGLGLLVRGALQRWLPAPALPALARIDCLIGRVPFLVSSGRFFVLDLERR
jgi:SAM-dependent methyltransferase